MKEMDYKLRQVTGADTHVKPLDSRIARTPVTDVQWTGARGTSECVPLDARRSTFLDRHGQTSVCYDRTGEPNFRPFETTHVLISDMSMNRDRNFRSANQKLLTTQWAKDRGMETVKDCKNYLSENHLTWHECSDGVTMRLVDADVNNNFGHSGGVAELKAMDTQQPYGGDLLRAAGRSSAELGIAARKKGVEIQENVSDLIHSEAVQAVRETAVSAVHSGASAALVTLTVSGINNLVEVAQAKKDLPTALKDVAQDASGSFVSAAGVDLAQKAVSFVAEKSQSEFLAGLAQAEIPVAQIAMTVMVANSVRRYLDGDLSAEDCAVEIILNGAGTLAYQFGMAVGGPVGAIIASIVTTQITNVILEYRMERKIRQRTDAEVERILTTAKAETERQSALLREYFQADLDRWDQQMTGGFAQIDRASRHASVLPRALTRFFH